MRSPPVTEFWTPSCTVSAPPSVARWNVPCPLTTTLPSVPTLVSEDETTLAASVVPVIPLAGAPVTAVVIFAEPS